MRTLAAFAAGLIGALAFGWGWFPTLLYESQPQPLAFNHRIHKEKGAMECAACHETDDRGQFAGVPKVANCATCHAAPIGTSSAETTLASDYVTPEREPAWKVYARQPANVRFSHAVHVNKAAMACAECHGNRGESTASEPYLGNRITGESRNVWGPRMLRIGVRPGQGMKMSDCEACHAERGVNAGCLGCHR